MYELAAQILKWLDEMWLRGELKEVMSEEEYLALRKAIEERANGVCAKPGMLRVCEKTSLLLRRGVLCRAAGVESGV